MHVDREAGYELLRQAVGLGIEVVESSVMEMEESVAQRILLQLDEEELECSAIGFLFAIGLLSFADAAPRGNSVVDYVEDDEFRLGDLLLHLRFERGELHLTTDYLRGRMMKTDVDLRPDGRVTITTRNRGEAASRWVMRLQGKKVLRPVEDEAEPPRDERDE